MTVAWWFVLHVVAEFSLVDGFLMYSINIIPTGVVAVSFLAEVIRPLR